MLCYTSAVFSLKEYIKNPCFLQQKYVLKVEISVKHAKLVLLLSVLTVKGNIEFTLLTIGEEVFLYVRKVTTLYI